MGCAVGCAVGCGVGQGVGQGVGRAALEPPAQPPAQPPQHVRDLHSTGVTQAHDGQFVMRFGCEDPHGEDEHEKSPTPESSSRASSRASSVGSRADCAGLAAKAGSSHMATMKQLKKTGATQAQAQAEVDAEAEEGARLRCEPGPVNDAHIFGAGETPELRKHLGFSEAVDSVALGSIDPQSALNLFGAGSIEVVPVCKAPNAATTAPAPKAVVAAPAPKAAPASKAAPAPKAAPTGPAGPAAKKPSFASRIPAPKTNKVAEPRATKVAATKATKALEPSAKPKKSKAKLEVRCSLEKLQAEHAEALAFLQELDVPIGASRAPVPLEGDSRPEPLTARSDKSSCTSMAEAALEAAKAVLEEAPKHEHEEWEGDVAVQEEEQEEEQEDVEQEEKEQDFEEGEDGNVDDEELEWVPDEAAD